MQLYEQILKKYDDKFSTGYKDPLNHSVAEIIRDEHKSFLKQSFIKYLKDECERLEGLTKTGSNGEGLPFENSPDIYGNQRVEAYKKGYNQAISDQITHITNQIQEIESL